MQIPSAFVRKRDVRWPQADERAVEFRIDLEERHTPVGDRNGIASPWIATFVRCVAVHGEPADAG